jgi:hypothetical protein
VGEGFRVRGKIAATTGVNRKLFRYFIGVEVIEEADRGSLNVEVGDRDGDVRSVNANE